MWSRGVGTSPSPFDGLGEMSPVVIGRVTIHPGEGPSPAQDIVIAINIPRENRNGMPLQITL
jgi:hypothetical protein